MRIVIVGAGAVGSYLAARLSGEGQDVVVIDSDPERAAELQGSVDALVLHGNGASPAMLREAGAPNAELLIAVSNSDGVNVLACHAGSVLGVQRTVARIEDPDLTAGIGDLGVDVVIDPGEMAAREVFDLVRQRGVSDIVEFADGQLTLVGGIVREDSPLLDRTLADLRHDHAEFDWAVGAVVRHGETLSVRGATRITRDDHVLLVSHSDDLDRCRLLLRPERRHIERVIVLGATRVAELATDMLLEAGLEVVVVDHEEDRCRLLADRHPKALIICGSPTDPGVLGDLGLGETDALAALSGWDDLNLTACLVGKALGASTALSRFHRLSYIGLLIGSSVDASVSSRLAAANAILHFVRRGRIHAVSTFKDTEAEALDLEVAPGSAVDGCAVRDLDLPPTAVIGGVARGGQAFVPSGDTRLQGGDRIIVFAPPEAIPAVEAIST